MGGLGVKDYLGREPNPEQLQSIVCPNDAKPGFSFVMDTFAGLLEDSFLQNITGQICQSTKQYPHKIEHPCVQKQQ